jgi:hypothetical protein
MLTFEVVGKSDEIIALPYSVDFFSDETKGLVVMGTLYFNGALIS